MRVRPLLSRFTARFISGPPQSAIWRAANQFRRPFASRSLRSGLIGLLLIPQSASPAQYSVSAEYRSKANFLVKFLDFIEWPESAFPTAQAPFLICVRGDFLFGTALAEVARGSSPHGRHIEVLWLREGPQSRRCHILFVSRSESRRYATLLQGVDAPGVLTIGETPDFLEAGGVMTFVIHSDANQRPVLQFEVNLLAATAAHLKISSKLLAVARRVVNRSEATKGSPT